MVKGYKKGDPAGVNRTIEAGDHCFRRGLRTGTGSGPVVGGRDCKDGLV